VLRKPNGESASALVLMRFEDGVGVKINQPASGLEKEAQDRLVSNKADCVIGC